MTPRSPNAEVITIGYGSLMSGLGLGPLRVRTAARVALPNARRGFGKFSQHGDRFAMLLEPSQADQPLEAHWLAADDPPSTAMEGIAFVLQPTEFARLCDREGYSAGQRLRQEASAQGVDVAAFLWSILGDAAYDIGQFRQRLFKLVGYTSPHYIPHPVRINGNRFAVTFLAPGREGSGSERVVPVRLRTGNVGMMSIVEAWHHKPNRTQLDYFAACLLGAAHGVSVRDLLEPLLEDAGLAERVRQRLADEQRQELPRFLELTGMGHDAYWQAFGPPTQSLRRSGLEDFLRALAGQPLGTKMRS